MMKSIGEILKKQMKQTAGWKQVEASAVVGEANKTLQGLFGIESKKFAQAVYFKNKTIAVTCLSSIMAQEIKLNEKKIISTINNKFGIETVEKIRYLA